MENFENHTTQGTPTAAGGDKQATPRMQKAKGAFSFVNEHATQYVVHGFFAGCGLVLASWAGKKLKLIGGL